MIPFKQIYLIPSNPMATLGNVLLGHLGGSVGWAPDFGSGHDLTVCEFEPHIKLCADSMEPALDSLSPSLCPSTALSLSVKNK